MTLFLPPAYRDEVKKWYSDKMEDIFTFSTKPKDAYNVHQDWRDGRRYQPLNTSTMYPSVSEAQFINEWASFFTKFKGKDYEVASAEDLFYLTKMLAIPQSPQYKVFRMYADNRGVLEGNFGALAGDYTEVTELGTFPAGAGDGIKKTIFTQKIKPGIIKHYTKVLGSPNLDEITKNVLRQWWASADLSGNFLKLAPAFYDVKDLTAVDDAGVKIPGINVISVNIRDNFFVAIFEGNGELGANVLDALGFSQFLRDNDPNTGKSTAATYTLEGLEAAAKNGTSAYADIVTTTFEIDTDLTEEDFNDLNQCALMSGLLHKDVGLEFHNYIEPGTGWGSPLSTTGSGNERIYPVTYSKFNPNKLINNCVMNKKIKNIFSTTDTKTPHNMVKGIFWVYESTTKGNKILREAELSTNSTAQRKKVSTISKKFSIGDPESDRTRFKKLDKERDSSYFFLENTKINFEGTDPSSARNDVQVEMTWKLGSLEGLGSTMAILGTNDGQPPETSIKIMDLITLPNTGEPNSSNGAGQYLTNQYSPNYSRLRLKVAPYGDKDGNHQEDCMILDLAIIDHKISRSSETGETTLTINYRGYFEATMNMPYNDALASPELIDARQKRQKQAIDKLKDAQCKPETVREMFRMEQEISKKESATPSAGTILVRLQKRNLIHQYELDKVKLRASTFGNTLDGRQMYVSKVWPSEGVVNLSSVSTDLSVGVITEEEVVDALAGVLSGDSDKFEKIQNRQSSLEALENKFFFLGDLMWTLLDCLYEPGSASHRGALKNLNLRFIMGTIYVPDPKNLGGAPVTINPISVPVDLRFFVQWFQATVVNKGLAFYPVGTFIRDLIERLVNNVIYDTCFSLLLPDENPPQLRNRTFVSSDNKWFVKKTNGWFDPKDPHQNSPDNSPDLLFPKSLIATKDPEDVKNNTWSHSITSTNYCVIYQQFPSYKRQLAAEDNGYLRDDEYTPTIYYGAKNKNYNFLSDVSFSKTNSPFLREARFFNEDNGGLSLLSNVYDLSFSFKRRKANTLFYPGCIINFALLDWGKRWVEEPPWFDDGEGDITHYFGTGILGEADPHREGTMSNIMGMGGYFIILSVEYNLGQTPGEFEINIATKFLGTDASKKLTRIEDLPKAISDNATCATAFNVSAERYNELLATAGSMEEPITRATIAPTTSTTTSTTGDREREVSNDDETTKENSEEAEK